MNKELILFSKLNAASVIIFEMGRKAHGRVFSCHYSIIYIVQDHHYELTGRIQKTVQKTVQQTVQKTVQKTVQ